jgi:hypothetical protein
VHSTFSGALNIALDDDDLVVVTSPRAGRLPNGVRLAEAIDFLALTSPMAPPARVWLTAAEIVVVGALVVDLAGAPVWSSRLPACRSPRREDVARQRAWLGRRIGRSALLRSGYASLRAAAITGDRAGVDAAVAGLCGLGPGLTPAGDDLLLGCQAVLQAAGHPSAGLLGRAIDPIGRTTAVAASLLRHAAAGRHAELTSSFVVALLNGESSAPASLDKLLAHGATSGRDTAEGVLLGLEIIAAEAATPDDRPIMGREAPGWIAP